MVAGLSDEHLTKLKRGGHDPEKVYAAYKAAVEFKGGAPHRHPGQDDQGLWSWAEAGEGKNITHQQKKAETSRNCALFRTRFGIPISDKRSRQGRPFYKPPEDSSEMQYLRKNAARLWAAIVPPIA